MSDSNDSNDSTDSSYSSESEVLCSYAKTFDSTSSSDESGAPDTGADIQSLVSCLSHQEKENLQNTIKHGISKQKGKVFPEEWGSFVSSKYKKLSENIIAVADVRESWVFGTRSLLEQMIEDSTRPKNILCDVCFFSSTNPLLVLTFMTSSAKTSSIMDYNSRLARAFIRMVQSGGEMNFDVVNGIVDPDRYQQTSLFLEKVNQIESECKKTAIPNSLYVDEDRYRFILTTFLSVGQILGKDAVQTGAHVTGAVNDLKQDKKDAEPKEEQVDMKEFRRMKQKVDQLQKDMEVLKWQLVVGTSASSDTGFESYETATENLSDTTGDSDHLPSRRTMKTGLGKSEASVGGDKDAENMSLAKPVKTRLDKSVAGVGGDTGQPERSRRIKKRFPRPTSPSTTITSGYIESSDGNSEMEILSDTETLQEKEHTDPRPKTEFLFGRSSQENISISTTVTPSDSSSQEKRSLIKVQSPSGSKNYYTVLYNACRDGKLTAVKSILSRDTQDINRKGPRGRTPVMMAALSSHREMFDLLVSKGADLSVVDDDKSTILNAACLSDNVEFVKYLLTLNIADINVRGEYGRTPVMNAAGNGCRKVFDLLVSKGADLSVVDNDKNTILNVACVNDNVEFVKYLLTLNNVDINVRGGQYGRTPVMNAAINGCRRVFDLLVSKGADLSVVDNDKDTILHVACLSDNVEFVKYLLTLNIADINVRGQYGGTPVMNAAIKHCRKVFDLLVSKGADLSVVDDDHYNILHVACIGGNAEVVKYLLSLDTLDINSITKEGQTPAMIARRWGNNEIIDLVNESQVK